MGGQWGVNKHNCRKEKWPGTRGFSQAICLLSSQARSCSTADWKLEQEGCSQASLGLGPSGPLWPFLSLSPQACTCWWEET